MPDPIAPILGTCLCGQLEFEVSATPLITMACHCKGCQKMTASAYSLSAAIPADGFRVTRGEPAIGALHGPTRHYFCPHCMSWLFTRPQGLDFFVNVRATLLADPRWTEPFVETCTDEKLAWASTPAKRSYAGFPPEGDYEGLMGAFAAGVG